MRTEKIVLDNGLVRAVFQLGSGILSEEYFAIDGKKSRLIAELSSAPNFPASLMADKQNNGDNTNIVPDYRNHLPSLSDLLEPLLSVGKLAPTRPLDFYDCDLREEMGILEVTFHARSSAGDEIVRIISLKRDEAYFKVTSNIQFARTTSLEFFADHYYFSPGANPDFTWTPSIKFDPTFVSADWTFKSPAVIIQKDDLALSLVPDVNSLGKDSVLNKCNVGLDMDITTKPKPVVTYGLIPSMPHYHSAFIHPKGLRVIMSQETVGFSYYLLLFQGLEKRKAYRQVTAFLWDKFGHNNFSKGHAAQKKPFNAWEEEAWHNEADKIWFEFDYDGEKCGAFRGKQFGIKYDAFFCGWWNNLATSYGLELYSRRTGDKQSKERARNILNLALKAPRNDGVFPVLYSRDTGEHRWDADHTFGGYRDFYHNFDMSWTSYWLLKWFEDLVPDDKRILSTCMAYGDFLVKRQYQSGFIPSYYDKDLKVKLMVPASYEKGLLAEIAELRKKFGQNTLTEFLGNQIKITGKKIRLNEESAEPAACAVFLAELYKVTRKKKYLQTAINAMRYLEKYIIPENKWFDYETFLSCSLKSYYSYDSITGQNPQNNMATIQAAKAFLTLYDLTGEKRFLESGMSVLDYLSLTQQVWSHPFLTPNLIGGFTTQNSDAEWSDARQTHCAVLYLDYFERTNRLEYLERGIAALRSPFPVSPYENWAHTGYLDRHGALSGFNWGLGSGMASVEMVWECYGDALVDIRSGWAYGVNGCTVAGFSLKANKLHLKIITELEWTVPLRIVFRNVPSRKLGLVVNGKNLGTFASKALKTGIEWLPKKRRE